MMKADGNHKNTALADIISAPLLKQLRQDVKTYIFYKKFKKIVDVCSGNGEQLRLLEAPDMELYGLDGSFSGLAQAGKAHPASLAYGRTETEHGATAEGYFDCAVISLALHEMHPADRLNIYAQARKAVRRGGVLVITDYRTPPSTLPALFLGGFLIPLMKRCASATPYNNYLNWMQEGALETFLDRRQETVDIISKRFAGVVLCCAVTIDDETRSYQTSMALLNQTFASIGHTSPR